MLPEDASWSAEFKAEIPGFPSVRHDDQADALTQLMNWVLRNGPVAGQRAVITPSGFGMNFLGAEVPARVRMMSPYSEQGGRELGGRAPGNLPNLQKHARDWRSCATANRVG